MSNYVPGEGNPRAKLMVVGEAPGAYEDAAGRPFVGPSGALLDEMLLQAGIARNDVYVTNVFKYRPPENDISRAKETGHTIEEGISQFREEVRAIGPNAILALGNLALSTCTGLTGILKQRGSIHPYVDGLPKVVGTIHPANLLPRKGRGEGEGVLKYSARYYIQKDIERAVEESRTHELRLPQRTLEVARSSADLWRFLQLYRHSTLVSVDIETVRCIPVCVGLAFTPDHALSVPVLNLVQPETLGWIAPHDLATIRRMLSRFFSDPRIRVLGQNFKFDHAKLERPLGIRIANVYADTMLLAHTLHCEFPQRLEFLCSVYTREPYYKDEGREFDRKKHKVDRLFLYNAKDAAVTMEVFEKMLPDLRTLGLEDFYFNFVMRLHGLYKGIDDVGFLVDEKKRDELWDKYTEWETRLDTELETLAGFRVNVRSSKDVPLLMFQELRLPARTSCDEDTLVALFANHAKTDRQRRAIELVLESRRVKKTKSTYLLAPLDFDGRIKTTYRITGTETGRSSTSKQGPPIRPSIQIGTRKDDRLELGLPFQNLTKHGEVGPEMREMLLPDPGCVLLEADQSQAEARIVALLANDEKLLELFDTVDIHRLTGTWCFGMPYEAITKEVRFVSKTVRHAGNYGMGKHRLMMEIQTNAKKFGINVQVSEWKAGQILDKFHAFSPKIRGVFHRDVVSALETNRRVLVNPFGRYRMFFERWGESLYKEAYAQIPQSTVADHTKRVGLALKDWRPDTRIVVESHDALVLITKIEEVALYAAKLKSLFETPIDFSQCTLKRGTITIPCELKIGDNYRELKDYKVAA